MISVHFIMSGLFLYFYVSKYEIMEVTIDINTHSRKAIALLNYLRELDFVSIKDEELLSEELKKALDEGIYQLDNGNISTHDQVVEETKQRYPNLFK